MKLDARSLSLASAAVMAIAYALCAAAVAWSPGRFMATVGYLTHVDLSSLARPVSWAAFFAGIVAWSAFAAIYGGATAGSEVLRSAIGSGSGCSCSSARKRGAERANLR